MPATPDPDRWMQLGNGSYVRRSEPSSDDFDFDFFDATNINATDAAVALAQELEVDLSELEGSGKDGKITVADVRESVA